jgi:hypothetical protein
MAPDALDPAMVIPPARPPRDNAGFGAARTLTPRFLFSREKPRLQDGAQCAKYDGNYARPGRAALADYCAGNTRLV